MEFAISPPQNGPVGTKRKANISIELYASNVTIGFDLGRDLDLEFSRSNMEFAISQPKMLRLPRSEKQIYRLNFRPQMWPSYFTFGHDLDLEFSRSTMEFAIFQPKVVRLPRNEKQTYRLNSRPQMWPMGLTFTMTYEFSRYKTVHFGICEWSIMRFVKYVKGILKLLTQLCSGGICQKSTWFQFRMTQWDNLQLTFF